MILAARGDIKKVTGNLPSNPLHEFDNDDFANLFEDFFIEKI